MSTPVLPTTKPSITPIVEDGPIRRFANSTVMADVTKALAQMPEGHTVSAIAFLDLETKSVKGALLCKLPAGWSVMGVVETRYANSKLSVNGQAAIMWSH